MQKHQYSDTVEKLATVEQAKERYKLCRNTLIKYAKQYDALRKFNTAVRIDIEKFDEGLSSENETNFKCREGIIDLTRLDNPKDADIFLQAAKMALKNRRRPVTVDYKYEDLID